MFSNETVEANRTEVNKAKLYSLHHEILSEEGDKQLQSSRKFYTLLNETIFKEHGQIPTTDEEIRDILRDGGTLPFGSGTEGYRILFRDYSTKDEETADGKVGWMYYPKPITEAGTEPYNNFLKIFGSNEVDLR